MNLIESEIQFHVEAKICGCNTNQKRISYRLIESDHCAYFAKSEIIRTQIQACQILLKNAKNDKVAYVIKDEIINLNLILAQTISYSKGKVAYCTSYGCKKKAIIICSVCFDFYSCGYEHAYLHKHLMEEFKVLA